MSAYLIFYQLFAAATDKTIIPANDNGPRPKKPYITLQVRMSSPQPVHRGAIDDEGEQALYSHRSAEIQLQVYGAGSWVVAESLAMKLHSEYLQELSDTLNISIDDQVRIQDVPMLIDTTTYESRAIIDMTGSYTASFDDDVGFIALVNGALDTESDAMPSLPFTVHLRTDGYYIFPSLMTDDGYEMLIEDGSYLLTDAWVDGPLTA